MLTSVSVCVCLFFFFFFLFVFCCGVVVLSVFCVLSVLCVVSVLLCVPVQRCVCVCVFFWSWQRVVLDLFSNFKRARSSGYGASDNSTWAILGKRKV